MRTFGSDPDMVIEMSKAFMDGVRETGADLAVTIKHFPGDGVDERDQHLLSTVNSLSAEEWEGTYGPGVPGTHRPRGADGDGRAISYSQP